MKIIKWIDNYIEEFLLLVLTVVMLIVLSLQVFMRFVMDNSLSWSEELSRYCFIWLIYIGISLGVKRQKHIRMSALLIFLKDKTKMIIEITANLLFLSFCVVIIFYGSELSLRFIQYMQTSPALGIPIGVVYLAAPVGLGLTSIRLIQNLIHQIGMFKKGNFADLHQGELSNEMQDIPKVGG